MQKNTNLLIRSKTPSYKKLKGSYRNLRDGTSPLRNAKLKTNYSKSPIKTNSQIKTPVNEQSKVSFLTTQEKQLKNKIKLLKKENDSLQVVLEKCEKEKELNTRKFENEKNQILEVFAKFIIKKKIQLSLVERPKSIRKTSMRDTSKSLVDRKSSKSIKKFTFTKKASQQNQSYIEIEKKNTDLNKNKEVYLLMKKDFQENEEVSSNIILLERFGVFDKFNI